MSKINVKKGDGKAPGVLAAKIIEGQDLPVLVKLAHKGKQPLVILSTNIAKAIPPGEAVDVKIRNLDQAWNIVSDLAALATIGNSDAEDFGVIEVPAIKTSAVEAPKPAKTAPKAAAEEGGAQ